MTLNQLRYFRILAKTEHYSRAADALSIAQPTLSRAIALLEEELGVLPFVVAMRRDDPLAKQPELTPDRLKGRTMVFTDSPAYSDLLNRMLGEYGVKPEITGYSNEDSVLLSMVQAGIGVFISTDHPQMYSPDTVLVPLRQERYRRYVYMVTRPGLASSTAAAQLIRYNQGRAVRERGRQPRADGGTED